MNFKCQICGKEFPADPDCMVEAGFSPVLESDDDIELEDDEEIIDEDQLKKMSEYELNEIGLSLEDRDKLLNGEDITTGGMCICKECQDKMEDES
jgi:hypothetical protein